MQAICRRLGFTKRSELSYKDFNVEGKKVFNVIACSNSNKTVISYFKVLNKEK